MPRESGPAVDPALASLIGERAAGYARSAQVFRLTARGVFALSIVVVPLVFAFDAGFGVYYACCMVTGVLGFTLLATVFGRRARVAASAFVSELYGRPVTLKRSHGTRPEAWKRAIDASIVGRED